MKVPDFEKNNKMKKNFPLSHLSAMKTGGCAKYAFFPETKEELINVIKDVKENNIKYCVIGNASNVIFTDEEYDGAVIFTTGIKQIKFLDESEISKLGITYENNKKYVLADAGASLTAFAYKSARENLSGLEFAYGIPGSVAGAVFMNAGAYGGEMKDVVVSVEYLDEKGEIKSIKGEELCFSYRHSFFQEHPECVILCAVIALNTEPEISPLKVSEANMAKRKEKQPLEYPNCGSAFKRPQGHFAGALIEDCNLKGFGIGGAYVSEKHAGFIINKGAATTQNVIDLISHIQKTVFEKHGVRLEPEIRIIK